VQADQCIFISVLFDSALLVLNNASWTNKSFVTDCPERQTSSGNPGYYFPSNKFHCHDFTVTNKIMQQ